MTALTANQATFGDEYLLDVSATRAAIRPGYRRRPAEQISFQLLQKTSGAEAVAQAMAERSEPTQITADQVLRELAVIAFADYGQYVQWDEDGVRVVPSSAVDTRAVAHVSIIPNTEGAIRIKLHDKLRALRLLAKHLGLFTEKVEVTGSGLQGALATLAALSPEQIQANLDALAALRVADGNDGEGDSRATAAAAIQRTPTQDEHPSAPEHGGLSRPHLPAARRSRAVGHRLPDVGVRSCRRRAASTSRPAGVARRARGRRTAPR